MKSESIGQEYLKFYSRNYEEFKLHGAEITAKAKVLNI